MTDAEAAESTQAIWSDAGAAGLRDLMNVFPSGVTVVTTHDRDGTPRGLTCTSMCSVSLRPPILLACLHNHSATLAALLRRRSFAVNILHAGGRGAAEVFATPGRDRFAEVAWCHTPSRGLPWLASDAHAVAECDLVDVTEAGDHIVVFGEVDDVLTKPRLPLLYGLHEYAAWVPGDGAGAEVLPLR